jgi:hypothetical protein
MHHSFRFGPARTAFVTAAVAALGLAGLVACQNKTPKETAPAPAAPAAAATPPPTPPKAKPTPPAPPPVAAKQLEWEDPPAWKSVKPSSSMRRATYEIPPAKGDKVPAELNVFILGGEVEPNIQRWVGEFSGFDPKTLVRHDRTVNDMPQAVVEIPKGTFSGGMNTATASDNYGLLGAIIVTPGGAEYFFKLTGPSATVKSARDAFYKMLDSMHLEGQPVAAPAATGKPAGAAKAASAETKPGAKAGAATPAPAKTTGAAPVKK